MVRRLIRKHKPVLVGLQETKREFFGVKLARFFWGTGAFRVACLAANGSSGGLVLLWDPDRLEVTEILRGKFSISVRCHLKGNDWEMVCTNVYGPSNNVDKVEFWNDLSQVKGYWQLPTLFFGDFNAVRRIEERKGSEANRRERKSFNNFMEACDLIEFDRRGPRFTYSNKKVQPSLSRLDRYVADLNWFQKMSGMVETTLGFFKSDHRAVLLNFARHSSGGPKPFRFQPHWFSEADLMLSLETWWNSFEFSGNPGFVLHKKLKALKEKIKDWVKENLSKVELKIDKLESLIRNLELEEEDRLLSEDERERKHKADLDLNGALR